MQFDFNVVTDRRNTGSLKWEVADQELPMWVADMDFQTAPAIQAAVQRRAAHGIYGYSIVPEEWQEAYIGWWKKRHGFTMEKDWLIFCTGVVPAISSLVRKLTDVGENVVIQTPVYNIFFNSILNNGRNVLESPLLFDGKQYQIDFEDLEEKLSNPQTTMMILCNPHNPVGKVWDRETLERIGALCWKHHVIVISDEIHCDLNKPGCEYVPFASVSEECRENSIICMSPTKAFNLAGLQTAAIAVSNPVLRHKANRGLNTDEVAEPNVFAVGAAIAAFTKGEPWLEELCQYVWKNKRYAEDFLKETSNIKVVPSEATYLLWLDCREIAEDAAVLAKHIRKTTGLYVTAGEEYGKMGKGFLRMNAACPFAVLKDGLERLAKGTATFLNR